jgi:hypothetical protein
MIRYTGNPTINPMPKVKPLEKSFKAPTRRIRLIWILSISLAGATFGHAQSQSQEEFICVFGSSQRVVSLFKTGPAHGPQACRVEYTRDGETKTVWASKNGYAFCVAKAASLVTKLAGGHYSCKPHSVGTPEDAPQ